MNLAFICEKTCSCQEKAYSVEKRIYFTYDHKKNILYNKNIEHIQACLKHNVTALVISEKQGYAAYEILSSHQTLILGEVMRDATTPKFAATHVRSWLALSQPPRCWQQRPAA